jgi:hypothetical protein
MCVAAGYVKDLARLTTSSFIMHALEVFFLVESSVAVRIRFTAGGDRIGAIFQSEEDVAS